MGDVRTLLRIGLLAAVTAALSFLRVPLPFSPVPVTGQTLGTMLAGLVLGPRDGALSQLVYVLMGAVGAPIFGGMGGAAVLVGPTGGYLVGMIPGAWLTGEVSRRGSGTVLSLAGCLLGAVAVVYGFGTWRLARVMGIDLRAALVLGALPYLPGDLVKALAAVGIAARMRVHS
ncbi:MAG: biotin transporter BioY [Bacillota bacterium]